MSKRVTKIRPPQGVLRGFATHGAKYRNALRALEQWNRAYGASAEQVEARIASERRAGLGSLRDVLEDHIRRQLRGVSETRSADDYHPRGLLDRACALKTLVEAAALLPKPGA